MPSPIAHSAMYYVIYRAFKYRTPRMDQAQLGSVPRLLLVAVGLSILPDLDSVVGVLSGDFGRFHNNLTHSLVVGPGAAWFVGKLASSRGRSSFRP